MRTILLAALALALVQPVFAADASSDLAKWDPRMANDRAVVDTNGVKWIDGVYLPLEGKAFSDVENFYDRLPAGVTTNVNGGVRGMKRHSSGMLFRFRTTSPFVIVRMTPNSPSHGMYHMTECGASGFDVYRRATGGSWKFVGSSHLSQVVDTATGERQKRYPWKPGDDCLINLPLYNGVRNFKIGIARDASVEALPPRASGVDKPVVFYGTSITHGGCATRPGLGFVNIVGRQCDVPVVGLGFSGSGVMEFEMSEHLARIDASCYVLDCLWNMGLDEKSRPGRAVETNYEPFIRNLRAKRPGVPIVMAEQCDVFCGPRCPKDLFLRKLYDKLVAEGWKDLVYLPKEDLYPSDTEGTVDGCHPNDLGMMSLAAGFGKAVKEALRLR